MPAAGDIIRAFVDPSGAIDASTGSTSPIGTTETVIATINNFTFRGGWAYRAWLRGGLYADVIGRFAHLRLRKSTAAGTDWGEYGRVEARGTGPSTNVMVNGDILLLRSAATDLTATVVLTCAASAGTVTVYANSSSPRFLALEPLGPAVEYAGGGVEVS